MGNETDKVKSKRKKREGPYVIDFSVEVLGVQSARILNASEVGVVPDEDSHLSVSVLLQLVVVAVLVDHEGELKTEVENYHQTAA